MAVAELSTPSYTKTHLFQSSQLSSLSTHLHSHRRVAFRPLPRTQNARICCSVAPNQVQAPAAPAQTEDPKNKPECFGVFCLTYNLKADEELIAAYNQVIHFLKITNKLEPQVLKIQGVLKINESLKKEVDELQHIRVGLLGALLV